MDSPPSRTPLRVSPVRIRQRLLEPGPFEPVIQYSSFSSPTPYTSPNLIKEPGSSDADSPIGVGVIVYHEGKVLVGRRLDNGLIGGPGGHIQEGETPEEAAMRETEEEFKIVPKKLIPMGQLEKEKGKPHIFLCTEFEGVLECDDEEMTIPEWRKISELDRDELFPPFAASMRLFDGGPGSGNFEHKGNPPHVGGSGEGKTSADPADYDWSQREDENEDDYFDRISNEADRLGVSFNDKLMILAGANPFKKKSPQRKKLLEELNESREERERVKVVNLKTNPLPGLENLSPQDQFRAFQYAVWRDNSRETFSSFAVRDNSLVNDLDNPQAKLEGDELHHSLYLDRDYEYSPEIKSRMEAMADLSNMVQTREGISDLMDYAQDYRDNLSLEVRDSMNLYVSNSGPINKFLGSGELPEDDPIRAAEAVSYLREDHPEALKALGGDTDLESLRRNPELRNRLIETSLSMRILDLDSIIDGFELSTPVVVRRRTSLSLIPGSEKISEGMIITPGVFWSTSVIPTSISQIRYNTDDVEVQISVPAGKGHGAFLNPGNAQYELLLNRNAKYRVVEYDSRVPRLKVVMEYD
jgi:8-oxo-dGTP pyrophosphatase MutT (NUDIX family)